jgi:hypothetical protein
VRGADPSLPVLTVGGGGWRWGSLSFLSLHPVKGGGESGSRVGWRSLQVG